MRLHRFCILQPLGEEVVINDVSLVNQWTKVFRYTVSDFVILFNGDGHDYCYSIQEIHKKSCVLKLTKTSPSYIPSQKITLCLSLIKKDNFELAVQKATELGVTTIVPVLSSRSEKKNLSFERLEKIAVESAEQCGRGDIPNILPITTLKETLLSLTDNQQAIFLNMGGKPFHEAKKNLGKKEAVIFIGPEGGWSSEDITITEEMGIQSYALGETVLRAETAVIASLSLLILS